MSYRERNSCKELLINYKNVIGFFMSFELIAELIKNEINEMNYNIKIIKWCKLEGYLYALQCIIDKSN